MSEDPKKPQEASFFQQSLRKTIRETVVATNTFLASLEKTSEEISQPLAKGLKSVEREGSTLACKARHFYERRHEFGPHLVVGSAFTVGGLVALRRGRFTGAFSGALAAGLTYVAVYDLTPLEEIPDLFGKTQGWSRRS
jgi:hypothetical protein